MVELTRRLNPWIVLAGGIITIGVVAATSSIIADKISENSTHSLVNNFNNTRTPDDFDKDGFSNAFEISLGFNYLDSTSHPTLPESFLSEIRQFSIFEDALNQNDYSKLLDVANFGETTDSLYFSDYDADGLTYGMELLVSNFTNDEYHIFDNNSDLDKDGLIDGYELFVFDTNPSIPDGNSNGIFTDYLQNNPEKRMSTIGMYMTNPNLINNLGLDYTEYRNEFYIDSISKLTGIPSSLISIIENNDCQNPGLSVFSDGKKITEIMGEKSFNEKYSEYNRLNNDPNSHIIALNLPNGEIVINTGQTEKHSGLSDLSLLNSIYHELIHNEEVKLEENEISSRFPATIDGNLYNGQRENEYKIIEVDGLSLEVVNTKNPSEHHIIKGFNEVVTELISEQELLNIGITPLTKESSYAVELMRSIFKEVGINQSDLREIMTNEEKSFPYLFNQFKNYFEAQGQSIPQIFHEVNSVDKVWKLFFLFDSQTRGDLNKDELMDKMMDLKLFDKKVFE